jgi:hypothetical protein
MGRAVPHEAITGIAMPIRRERKPRWPARCVSLTIAMPRNSVMKKPSLLLLCATAALLTAPRSQAFCGFYAGRADSDLFNTASKVIMVRDGPRTVISMMNDYSGDPSEFALVVPVPQVLGRDQIHVGDRAIFDRLDAFSAPRLAEYYDEDPCERRRFRADRIMELREAPAALAAPAARRALGVQVEAAYTVGEYDIVILSARQSEGLETWLRETGYRIPAGASRALRPYVRQGMRFFVARVNLKEHARTGTQTLRPLQFAFDSEKFMLPIRLGMVNARGPQDLIAFFLTRRGRVETTNYRTVEMPTDAELPLSVRGEFGSVYRAVFDEQARREKHRVVFTEFFWDAGSCDPCAAEPPTPEELRRAGVFWFDAPEDDLRARASPRLRPPMQAWAGTAVMLTRLHVRYTPETFPEDLVFQETGDRRPFQVRHVLRHPFPVQRNACPEAAAYLAEVRSREQRQAMALASLTGWPYRDALSPTPSSGGVSRAGSWWSRLWN